MNIVVSRDALSCVSTFAKALAGRGVSAAQMNSCKIAMLNQLKGFICQMQGRDMTAPVKRRWLFKDGFGGAWSFVFTFYPQQQLAIINSMSKTLLKKPIRFNTLYNDSRKNPKDPHQQETNPFSEIESMFDTQDDNMENESKIARPNVIRITEADLRYIISETTKQLIAQAEKKANDCLYLFNPKEREAMKKRLTKYFIENPTESTYIAYQNDQWKQLMKKRPQNFQLKPLVNDSGL